jgi:uncharacterized membrane protein
MTSTPNGNHRHRRALLVGMLALTTVASLALQLVRQSLTGEGRFWMIAWDLFLAWVPLAAAVALEWRHRHPETRNWIVLTALAVLWLLFFPNAPYLVTEFVHLRPYGATPNAVWWCDLVVILLIAWNGVLLGFASLYLVQQVIRDHIGAVGAWFAAAACIALASLGISIGRFERLNSWDALIHPAMIADCLRQFTNAHVFAHNVGLAILLGGMLLLQYVTLAALIGAVPEKSGALFEKLQ